MFNSFESAQITKAQLMMVKGGNATGGEQEEIQNLTGEQEEIQNLAGTNGDYE